MKTMKQLMNGALVAILAVSALAAPALAEGGAPPDSEFLGVKPVGVLPVLAPGLSRRDAYQRVAALALGGEAAKPVAAPSGFVSMDGAGGGFAFAGSAEMSDILVMQYAFMLGALPTDANDPAAMAKSVAALEQSREALAPLSPEVVKAVDAFVASAKAGKLDPGQLANALMAAEKGIADGPARAHGYFASGLWLGLSMLAAAIGEADQSFLAMSGPLAVMLEEDAQFGGADRKLATVLRGVTKTFTNGKVDQQAYLQALAKIADVKPDEPPQGDGGGGAIE